MNRDVDRAASFGAWLAASRPELTPAEVGASYARAYGVAPRHAAVRAAAAAARRMRRSMARRARSERGARVARA